MAILDDATGIYVEYYHVDKFGVRVAASGYRFVPSPMMEISRESYTTSDGNMIGGGYIVSLEGSLLPATTSGTKDQRVRANGITNIDETFTAKSDLINAFRKNGGILQGKFLFNDPSCDTVAFWSSGVVLDSLQFSSPSQWVTRVDYTAEIFCPNTFVTGLEGTLPSAGNLDNLKWNKDYLSGVFESQSHEFNVDVFAKSQQVNTATGIQRTPTWFSVGVSTNTQTMRGKEGLGYNTLKPSIDRAINSFLDKSITGAADFDSKNPEKGPISGVGKNAIHTQRSLGVDYAGGSTSHTDTYVGTPTFGPTGMLGTGLTTGPAVDTYDINIDSSVDTSFVTVTVDGNIQGLEPYNGGGAVDAANAYLNSVIAPAASMGGPGGTAATGHTPVYERALSLYNSNSTTSSKVLPLNTEPMSKSIGYNTNDGTASYALTYSNRPATCFNEALSETISISRDNATDVHASLTILGRANGPILQDIGTKTASTTSINIEAFLIPPTGQTVCSGDLFFGAPEYYEEIIDLAESGISGDFGTFYRTSDSKSWDPRQGRFTRNVAWIHTDC